MQCMAKSDNKRNDFTLPLRVALGVRIRTFRKTRGINQDDFADMVGIQRAHVGLIENAKVEPRIGTLFMIAQALGLGLEEQVAGVKNEPIT
jgi:transcriptional regulator with XRE-family HTH domain